jgi:hypothetical protein
LPIESSGSVPWSFGWIDREAVQFDTTRQQANVDRLQAAAFGEHVFHCTVDLIVGNGVDTQNSHSQDNQQQNQQSQRYLPQPAA